MKEICFVLFLLLIALCSIFATEDSISGDKNKSTTNKELFFATRITEFYNQLLSDQDAIEKINSLRPNIYIYTDFGGGNNRGKIVADLQTSGEIMSAAWKGTLQQELYFNDSAEPLSPIQAAIHLAKTFPYEFKHQDGVAAGKMPIHTIVGLFNR